jgi:5-methylcytosine-specific restriction endonuclease McrA
MSGRVNGAAHYYANNVGRTSATWRKLRLQCFARDKKANAPCWICGQPIDYAVRPSSTDESYEPDHRFPVHSHPELAEVPDNILPSHRKCNRARRNSAGVSSLGKSSRAW